MIYKEEIVEELFDESSHSESDVAIVDLLDSIVLLMCCLRLNYLLLSNSPNNILNEEFRELKREHEIHVVRLCEVT